MFLCEQSNVLNGFAQPVNSSNGSKSDNKLYINGTNCIDGQDRTAKELNDALNQIGDNTDRLEVLERRTLQVLSTGLYQVDGGGTTLIQPTSATTIAVTGGKGQFVDRQNVLAGGETIQDIIWPTMPSIDIVPLLPAPTGNWPVVIDNTGTILIIDSKQSSKLDVMQRQSYIQLGVISTVSSQLTSITSGTYPAYNTALDPYALSTAIGVINSKQDPLSIEPSVVFSSLLRFKINAGSAYSSIAGFSVDATTPNTVVRVSDTDPQPLLGYALRDGSIAFPPTQEVDPNQYEISPGVLAPVGPNKITLQRVFLFPANGIIGIIYGDEIFTSLSDAFNSSFFPPPILPITSSTLHIADLAIESNTTDFTQPDINFQLFDPLNPR